jgi:hypothetical protein
MVSGLIRTRFVAFDTNQLGNWCRERKSSDRSARLRAARFEESLASAGIIPLLTWHHLEELLAIENQDAAASRIAFLSGLPLVAWIASANDQMTLGGIVDVLAAEVAAALTYSPSSALTTRDLAAQSLIRVGSGQEAMTPFIEIWRDLQLLFWARAKNNRAHVAVVESQTFDISDRKVADLLNGRLRAGTDLERQLHGMGSAMSDDIAKRGDKRISNPAAVADWFMGEVVHMAMPWTGNARDLVLRGLAQMDVEPGDIEPDTTMADIGALSVFRKRVRVAALSAGLSETRARRLPMDVFPSWLIDEALNSHAQDQAERKGSNLTDRYLAALAPYADMLFVDKRTMETFRRVFAKSPDVAQLVRDVRRATNYFDSISESRREPVEKAAKRR